MEFQRKYEKRAFNIGGNFLAPVQKVEDFLNNIKSTSIGSTTPTVLPGYTLANLRDIYPESLNNALCEGLFTMDKKLNGFISEGILTGVETRSSSPIRILRNNNMESISISGLYPLGEGSGYSGGIMSSALDGIKGAIAILKN